jgi:uncharacterized protein (TIGR03086 family)
MDLLDLDRRALAATGAHVDALGPDDLTRPTPCAEWDVRALLNHVLGNNHLYATAVSGAAVDWAERDRDRVGDDPAGAYAASAAAVTAAFAAADLGVEVDMPFGRLAAAQAVAVHFVDVLAHGWDLAVGLGRDPGLDPDLAAAAIDIVAFYPPDVFGTPVFFAEQQPCPADAPPDVRLVALLGRTP